MTNPIVRFLPRMARLALLVLCGVGLDLVLHILIGDGTFLVMAPPSAVSRVIGIFPAIILYLVWWFALVGGCFLVVAHTLPGTPAQRGLRFGLLIGLMTLVGMWEISPILGTTLWHETLMGLADGIPLALMCWALGAWVPASLGVRAADPSAVDRWRKLTIIATVASFFVTGRYLAYSVFGITSSFIDRPVATFAWTIAMGLAIGVAAAVIPQSMSSQRRLAWFAGLFGINWLVFNLFMPFVFDKPWLDFFCRAATDTVFCVAGLAVVGQSMVATSRPFTPVTT